MKTLIAFLIVTILYATPAKKVTPDNCMKQFNNSLDTLANKSDNLLFLTKKLHQ